MTKKQQQTGSFWIWDWEFVKPCSEQLKIPKELTQDVNDPKKVVLLHDFGLLPTPYYRAVGTDWPSPNPHDLGRSGSIILSGDGEFMTPPVLFVPPLPRIFWSSYGPVTKSRSSSHANSPWYALTCNICEFGGSDVSNFDLMAQNIPLGLIYHICNLDCLRITIYDLQPNSYYLISYMCYVLYTVHCVLRHQEGRSTV